MCDLPDVCERTSWDSNSVFGLQIAQPPQQRVTPTEFASRMVSEEPGLQTVDQVRALCMVFRVLGFQA